LKIDSNHDIFFCIIATSLGHNLMLMPFFSRF
jgi:hypothetical protein